MTPRRHRSTGITTRYFFLYLCVLVVSFFFPGQAMCADHEKANNQVKANGCAKAEKWYQQGIALSDDSPEEMDCYRKAIELCPQYWQAHERLGDIYKARRQYDLAITEFRLAAEAGSSSDPHTSLGEIYRMQGRYDLAVQEFQTALDIRAEDKRAQSNLEYIYRMSEREDDEEQEHALVPSPIFSREPGFTIPQGVSLVDLHLQSSQIRREWIAPVERSVNIGKLITGIRYGVTDNFMVGLIPKMLWKKAYIHVMQNTTEQEYQPSVYGLGDTILMLKQSFWSCRQSSWAASLDINLPTGDEQKTTLYAGNYYSIPLGSGKYEFMPGLAFSSSLRNIGYFHASLYYFFTRQRDDGIDPGDEFSYNVALCRPVPLIGNPYFLSMPVTALVGLVELNGVYRGKSKGYRKLRGYETAAGQGEENVSQVKISYPGGNTLFWSPGVQVLFCTNAKLELAIQVPLLTPDDPWITKPVYQIGVTKFFF